MVMKISALLIVLDVLAAIGLTDFLVWVWTDGETNVIWSFLDLFSRIAT